MNAFSTRRYLSVWLRRLATDRIARASPAPADKSDQPLVIVASIKSALRITALNDAAARLRLKTGMALADARAMYPSLAVEHADPDADQRLLEAIADWCDRYTPLVGLAPPDGLAFDITGCAHLFGGEKALCRDLMTRLAAQGFATRVAVADTLGCAFAAAHFGEAEICLVPPAGMRETLAPLPLAALRLAPQPASQSRAGIRLIRPSRSTASPSSAPAARRLYGAMPTHNRATRLF